MGSTGGSSDASTVSGWLSFYLIEPVCVRGIYVLANGVTAMLHASDDSRVNENKTNSRRHLCLRPGSWEFWWIYSVLHIGMTRLLFVTSGHEVTMAISGKHFVNISCPFF